MTIEHTCDGGGRSSCDACLQLEGKLWGVINRYAITVGGNPSRHVYGNVDRMQSVVDVGTAIDELISMRASLQEQKAVAARGLCGAPPATEPLPTNPDCTGTVGRDFVACGEEGYYCSDRCWTIGRLRAARALVAKYELQLGVYAVRDSGSVEDTGGSAS